LKKRTNNKSIYFGLEEEFFVNDSIDIEDMNMETIFNEFEHSSKVENQKIVPSPKLAPKNELDSNSFSFVEDVLKFIADQTCLICDVESDSMSEAINHVEKYHFNLIVEESIKNEMIQTNDIDNMDMILMNEVDSNEENNMNENTMAELKIENVQTLQNINYNSNEEVEEWGSFIEENYETMKDSEQSECLPKIQSVGQLKDLTNQNHEKEMEIDSNAEKSEESSEIDIKPLSQFNCPLCNDKYDTAKDMGRHVSNFHRITNKRHRKSLVMQSKDY
jgi:hypothetical protein